MNYSTLTKTQRRCIDAFIKLDPSLANSSSISRQYIEKLWHQLFDMREAGGEKIGYPMWLVKGPKVARGEYAFPSPNSTVGNIQQAKNVIPSEMSKEDEEFFAEIAEAGLLEEVV